MPLAKGDTMKILAAAAATALLTVPVFAQRTVTAESGAKKGDEVVIGGVTFEFFPEEDAASRRSE